MSALLLLCLLFSPHAIRGPIRLPSGRQIHQIHTAVQFSAAGTGYRRANQDVEQTFRALEREDRQQQDRISQPRSSAQREHLPDEHHKLSPFACIINMSFVVS